MQAARLHAASCALQGCSVLGYKGQVAGCKAAALQAAALARLQAAKLKAAVQSLVSTPVRGVNMYSIV